MSYKTILFVLALVLTMNVASASDENPWGVTCPEGSTVVPIVTHPCGGGPVTVQVCWKCPELNETTLTVSIIGGFIFGTPPPNVCADFWEDIANEVSNWAKISLLCPAWTASFPPCSVSTKIVYIKIPLCWQYINTAGTISMQTCPTNTCECVTEYQYCFDGISVVKTTIHHGIHDILPYTCNPSLCPSAIYTIPLPAPGTSSGCGYMCQ